MTRRFDPSDLPPLPDLRFELDLWAQGFTAVAGLDEAGRGAWAGPVSAGAVILPTQVDIQTRLHKVRDSKQMRPAERAFWAKEIQVQALAWGVGLASNLEIDQIGILPATRLAMERALAALTPPPDYLLIDALRLPALALPQTDIIKGDARALSIAAASVLAKTTRDAIMIEMELDYPGYYFSRHKGYGTAAHQSALKQLGPCAIHRFSFSPVRQAEAQEETS
jgi:ribonuclease HII